MDPGKNLEQNLDDFKRISISLTFVDDEKIGDESQTILLNSLSDSYKEVKSKIKFGRKSITLDGVIVALRSWEMEITATLKNNGIGESISVRGRHKDKNQYRGRSNTRSKSRNRGDKWRKKVKCFNCQEVGHTKRFCPKKKQENKEQDETRGKVVVAQDGY